jgi:ribA/ribD-fused uncharacterized protein
VTTIRNTAAVNRPEAIVWFDDFEGRNRYRFLSNFYVGSPINFDGDDYPTGEHLFASLKTTDPDARERIRGAATPGDAKRLGRKVLLRPNWELLKYDAMRLVLRLKFAVDRPEAELLLQTHDALLVEGTYWNDRCWGVDLRPYAPEASVGRNWLGTLLMARRAELRAHVACGWEPNFDAVVDFVDKWHDHHTCARLAVDGNE